MTKKRLGRASLFRGKDRSRNVNLTLTPHHHRLLKDAMARLGLSRADVIGLLIDKFSEVVEVPPEPAAR